LRSEVSLTNTIINMIKTEQVYDIKDNMLDNENKIIELPKENK